MTRSGPSLTRTVSGAPANKPCNSPGLRPRACSSFVCSALWMFINKFAGPTVQRRVRSWTLRFVALRLLSFGSSYLRILRIFDPLGRPDPPPFGFSQSLPWPFAAHHGVILGLSQAFCQYARTHAHARAARPRKARQSTGKSCKIIFGGLLDPSWGQLRPTWPFQANLEANLASKLLSARLQAHNKTSEQPSCSLSEGNTCHTAGPFCRPDPTK